MSDLAAQLLQQLEDPHRHIEYQAATTFGNWYDQVVAALERAGVPHEEAAGAAHEVVSGVLNSIQSAATAMTDAMVAAIERAAHATRH